MRCASSYDKRVTIEQVSGSADVHGHLDLTDDANWSTYSAAYAAVQTKGGREFWKVNRVEADVSHVWTCPYTTKLAAATPKMRLVHDGVEYEIVSVIDINLAHIEVELQTRRAV